MKRTSLYLGMAAGLSLLISQSAFGQEESPGDEARELEDLVVTAALEPVSRNDVAGTVTIITREDIERLQVKYLGDLLRDVPGFAVSQSGGIGAQTQVRVRGAEANQMLVLIDGVRANDPASGDEFQFQYALTGNIERIEIIRGPQSSIWGSDAMAGVINIIRRKDSRDTWVSGNVEGGSFDTINASVDGGLNGENFRLQGGISYYDTEGINIARQGDEKDGANNVTADIGLDWDLAEAWRLSLGGQFVEAESEFDDFGANGLPADADRVTEAERSYLRGALDWAPDDSKWSANGSLNYTETDNQNFADGLPNSSTSAEVMDARLRGSLLLDGRDSGAQHRLTAGLDYIDTQFSQRGDSPYGDPNQDQEYDQTSFAGEYVGRMFEGFTWTASARYNDFSDFDNITTWQLGLSHQVAENYRVRGSVGTGFKAPTFTELYGYFPGQFIGNPDLKPEESVGWEAGIEANWMDGQITAGAVYFNQKLENEIDGFVFDPDLFLLTAENKESDSDRKGFELTFGAGLWGGLELSANYTYTDSTEEVAGDDVKELRRPKHMGALNLNYRFLEDRAYGNMIISYTGEQYDTFFDPNSFMSERVTLDSYTLVDLAGGWRFTDTLELTGRVTNLTDEDYENVLGYSTRGRAYYLGLRGRFDF